MFQTRLSELLKEKNLSASKVSRATGISRVTLTKYLRGNLSGIDGTTVQKLCEFLEIQLQDLIYIEDPKLQAA